MKKILVLAPVVLFLAASCNTVPSQPPSQPVVGSATQTIQQTQPQEKNNQPVLTPQPVQPSYGVQTKTSNCTANQPLPDSACTPGAILTSDLTVICKSGYTQTVRNVPLSEREQVFAEYGISYDLHINYEVDHLISLELGGSNDISNLFPEPYNITYGARVKDKLENYLHSQICSGKMTVAEAQREIATNWLKYYLIIYPQTPQANILAPTPAIVPTPQVNTNSSLPAVKKSTSGICHAQGTQYYDQTIHYTAYNSIDECLASGGRLPK